MPAMKAAQDCTSCVHSVFRLHYRWACMVKMNAEFTRGAAKGNYGPSNCPPGRSGR
jgi:hypothetical protein